MLVDQSFSEVRQIVFSTFLAPQELFPGKFKIKLQKLRFVTQTETLLSKRTFDKFIVIQNKFKCDHIKKLLSFFHV